MLSNSGYGIMKTIGSYEKGVVNSRTKVRGYVIDKSAATKWTSFEIFYFYFGQKPNRATSINQIQSTYNIFTYSPNEHSDQSVP